MLPGGDTDPADTTELEWVVENFRELEGQFDAVSVGARSPTAAPSGGACARRADGTVACWPDGDVHAPAQEHAGPVTAMDVSGQAVCLLVGSSLSCTSPDGERSDWTPPAGGVAVEHDRWSDACVQTGPQRLSCRSGRQFEDVLAAAYGSELWTLRPDGTIRGDTGTWDPPDGTEFVGVAGGDHAPYVCGWRTDGSASCGTPAGNVEFDASPGSRLEVGAGLVCALDPDGAISCWDVWAFLPVNVPPLTAFDLSVADASACAVEADGRLVCWDWDIE